MTVRLGVNVDHVATLRQARGTPYPEPVYAALLAQDGGADQITVHLREDRRHIVDRDLPLLRSTLEVPLNLEMAATPEMQRIALGLRPSRVTLVPERREERTTEGGLEIAGQSERLAAFIAPIREAGIVVSLFIAPDRYQLDASHAVGAHAVELHTGEYAEATGEAQAREFTRVHEAAHHAQGLGLEVAAGHGLHYRNTAALLTIGPIVELNIGHAIIARALFVGLREAVREMLVVMGRGAA